MVAIQNRMSPSGPVVQFSGTSRQQIIALAPQGLTPIPRFLGPIIELTWDHVPGRATTVSWCLQLTRNPQGGGGGRIEMRLNLDGLAHVWPTSDWAWELSSGNPAEVMTVGGSVPLGGQTLPPQALTPGPHTLTLNMATMAEGLAVRSEADQPWNGYGVTSCLWLDIG